MTDYRTKAQLREDYKITEEQRSVSERVAAMERRQMRTAKIGTRFGWVFIWTGLCTWAYWLAKGILWVFR